MIKVVEKESIKFKHLDGKFTTCKKDGGEVDGGNLEWDMVHI